MSYLEYANSFYHLGHIIRGYCTLAKITHRRRFHYRCIGAKSPWVPARCFGTLARRQEGEEQSG